jgi:hypothetical protein
MAAVTGGPEPTPTGSMGAPGDGGPGREGRRPTRPMPVTPRCGADSAVRRSNFGRPRVSQAEATTGPWALCLRPAGKDVAVRRRARSLFLPLRGAFSFRRRLPPRLGDPKADDLPPPSGDSHLLRRGVCETHRHHLFQHFGWKPVGHQKRLTASIWAARQEQQRS